MKKKKLVIVLSVIAVLVLSGLSLRIVYYYSPTQIAERTADRAAEKRFSEYLDKNFNDEISFKIGYISKAEIYCAYCINNATKEKFTLYEYKDGEIQAYSQNY